MSPVETARKGVRGGMVERVLLTPARNSRQGRGPCIIENVLVCGAPPYELFMTVVDKVLEKKEFH